METKEHSYNTRASKKGRQVYFKDCDHCNNQLPISVKMINHISENIQFNIQYHIHCEKCKKNTSITSDEFDISNSVSPAKPKKNNDKPTSSKIFRSRIENDIHETLPKRTKILSKRSSSPKMIINEIKSCDSNSDTSDLDSDTNSDTLDTPPEKKLLNILVDIANSNLTEVRSEDFNEFEEEPFEGLHKDIHYTDEERQYVKNLDEKGQKAIIELENNLFQSIKSEIPLRFKILNSDMCDRSKINLLSKIDHFYTLDPTDNEYQKLYPWVNQLDKIPFGKYIPNKITQDTPIHEIQSYLSETKKTMDEAVYGHSIAKTQIISAIAREISNPKTIGNCFAIQGPMGNGKTTLIKEGVCKAMGRPFGFIPLGGMQDSSYLLGHEITYEGSKCGRILEILAETNCMNPVIFFDELDKLSDTPKGQEISNLLCHLTDSSQNKEFHDKYFSGINFDLSRATFIFSYNDEAAINPILLDRMYRIKTAGFDKKDKTKIANEYLIPSLLKQFNLGTNDVTFEEETIHNLIDDHCCKEKGVRNLKRNIETIISKLNIMRYLIPDKVDISQTNNIDKNKNIIKQIVNNLVDDVINTVSAKLNGDQTKSIDVKDIVNYEIKNFKLPYNVTKADIAFFLDKEKENASFEHMYM